MAPHLRNVEKNVLIPRYMEYKIARELCAEENRLFAQCSRQAGLRVVIDCKLLLKQFHECANRWFQDEEFKKQMEQEYLAKRAKFRKTGVAEKSPITRFQG